MKKAGRTRAQLVDAPLIRAFLLGNPILALKEIARNRRQDKEYSATLRDMLLEQPIKGSSLRLKERWRILGLAGTPNVEEVRHVFPTVGVGAFSKGLMIPLGIEESPQWHLSDAFGRFKFKESEVPTYAQVNIQKSFEALLAMVEAEWRTLHQGETLPLRWRRSYSIRILIPLHLDMIDGESLQVPLLVAVLRALGQAPPAEMTTARLPFGNVPVFATGTLEAGGQFGRINAGLREKLTGFVREYGVGLPAILSDMQIKKLEASRTGSAVLAQVSLHRADDLAGLLRLPEIAVGLARLALPPHPTELDGLLAELKAKCRGIRFNDVAQACDWLLPNIESAYYRFHLLVEAGLVQCHRGRFAESHEYLLDAAHLIRANPEHFGIAERITLATHWGALAFDAGDASLANPYLRGIVRQLTQASEADRAKYWGTLCQLFRHRGRYDEAVQAGYRAVECADRALAKDAGRDRNYLIHALVSRARMSPRHRDRDLIEAAAIVEESRGRWAPAWNKDACASHLGFCLHYEAEIARLRMKKFAPPEKPPWIGDWGHPWLFVLLACSRNTAHAKKERIAYADRLLTARQLEAAGGENLFALLRHVYCVYRAFLCRETLSGPLSDIEAWCSNMKKRGFSGWAKRLSGPVRQILSGDEHAVEGLCDAIPYH